MDRSYTYMIRCTDGSVYTGITKDVKRRMQEHKSKSKECAKYTKTHSFQKLEAVFEASSWSDAAKLEYAIKRLSKRQKEALIADPSLVTELFGQRLAGCEFVPRVVE